MLLYGITPDHLLEHFRTVLEFINHHDAALNMKKREWLQYKCKFLGMDAVAGLKNPAHSKHEAFFKLGRHSIRGDICMLIGIF